MKVAVIDDEALIALDIANIVEEAGHQVVGPFSRIEDVERIDPHEGPDVALVDLRLGGGRCGATIDAYLRERFGTLSVYVTGNVDFAYRYRRTAVGFVNKPADDVTIIAVLEYLAALRAGLVPRHAPTGLTLFDPTSPLSALDRRPDPSRTGARAMGNTDGEPRGGSAPAPASEKQSAV